MSRPLRIEYPGAFYHVMNRGLARNRIFLNDSDRLGFLDLVGDICRLWGLGVYTYCLMDNHYHLLLQTSRGGLSRAMRHLDGIYTQRFNRRHGRDGPLFRGRYRAILIGCGSLCTTLKSPREGCRQHRAINGFALFPVGDGTPSTPRNRHCNARHVDARRPPLRPGTIAPRSAPCDP